MTENGNKCFQSVIIQTAARSYDKKNLQKMSVDCFRIKMKQLTCIELVTDTEIVYASVTLDAFWLEDHVSTGFTGPCRNKSCTMKSFSSGRIDSHVSL